MKTPRKLALICLLGIVITVQASDSFYKTGQVFCDANGSGRIDAGDTPVQSVLVVVTNLSGTFSNANWTSIDGYFVVQLPTTPDSYVDYIHPLTLPAGVTAVTPTTSSFNITAEASVVTNNFLISNTNCLTSQPPSQGSCWLSASGTIGGKGRPDHSIAGVVLPGCSPDATNSFWTDIAHSQKLQFKSVSITNVVCGSTTSSATNSNVIEFSGTGALKGIAGNKARYNNVFFFAQIESLSGGGSSYYLRVYNSAGVTLLLVSSNPSSPLEVAPIQLRNGDLEIARFSCP